MGSWAVYDEITMDVASPVEGVHDVYPRFVRRLHDSCLTPISGKNKFCGGAGGSSEIFYVATAAPYFLTPLP